MYIYFLSFRRISVHLNKKKFLIFTPRLVLCLKKNFTHRHTWWIGEILAPLFKFWLQPPSLNSTLLQHRLIVLQCISNRCIYTWLCKVFGLPPEFNSCLDTSLSYFSTSFFNFHVSIERNFVMLTVSLSTYNFVTLISEFRSMDMNCAVL